MGTTVLTAWLAGTTKWTLLEVRAVILITTTALTAARTRFTAFRALWRRTDIVGDIRTPTRARTAITSPAGARVRHTRAGRRITARTRATTTVTSPAGAKGTAPMGVVVL